MPWLVAALLIPLVLVAFYYGQPAKFRKARKVAGADPEDVARLGPSLAGWRATTRELIARIEVTSEHANVMLREELERDRTRKRNLRRQQQDATFLAELRRARTLGKQWHDEARALPTAERATLEDREIDVEPVVALLSLPWGLTEAHDFARDRTDEIESNANALDEARARLNRIDQALGTDARPGYR